MTAVAIYGTVRDVKRLRSAGTCVVEVELPIEAFLGAAPFCDASVLVTLAKLPRPYGVVKAEETKDTYPGGEDQRAYDEIEQRTELPREKHKPKFPTGLCGLAVKWCNDEHFYLWVVENFPEECAGYNDCDEQGMCKGVICTVCKIDTRKELDTNELAEHAFREMFLIPYKIAREKDGLAND
jgi:hypothetical protein